MPSPLLGYLFLTTTIMSVPFILLAVVGRRWLGRNGACAMVAASYALATGYSLWHVDHTDVWRHGIPPMSQLLIYAAYMTVFGIAGWSLGILLTRPR